MKKTYMTKSKENAFEIINKIEEDPRNILLGFLYTKEGKSYVTLLTYDFEAYYAEEFTEYSIYTNDNEKTEGEELSVFYKKGVYLQKIFIKGLWFDFPDPNYPYYEDTTKKITEKIRRSLSYHPVWAVIEDTPTKEINLIVSKLTPIEVEYCAKKTIFIDSAEYYQARHDDGFYDCTGRNINTINLCKKYLEKEDEALISDIKIIKRGEK